MYPILRLLTLFVGAVVLGLDTGTGELFPLDGRPHLVHVRIETTDVSSYQVLLEEVSP